MDVNFNFFDKSEMIHYFDSESNDFIVQSGNLFTFKLKGCAGKIKIPLSPKMNIFLYGRLSRRLARIDKASCSYLPFYSKIVIVYQYVIYTYSIDSKVLNEIQSLPFRNPLFMGAMVLNGKDVYFGEYFSNKSMREVNLYRSSDEGERWDVVYTFPKGSVFHIHSVNYDKYTDSVWVCTGDYNGQCKILRADYDFKNVEVYGDGSQLWRAVSMLFLEDRVVWGMDSPLDDVYIMSFDRETGIAYKGQPLDGPVWFSKLTTDNHGLMQTSVEYQYLKGVKSNRACLYVTHDFDKWNRVGSWKKDIYPHKYFRHGVIMFSDGNQSLNKFAIHGEGLIGLDGVSGLVRIDESEVK